MRAILSILALITTVLVSTSALAKLRVVTTTADLAHFVRTVGGSHVTVDTICRGDQDPHYVQARPSYMVKLSRADLLVAVGLELEVAWLPALVQGARNPKINAGKLGYLETSEAIHPIDVPAGPVDRSSGDVHPLGNPHYWLDPDNAQRVVSLIAERLRALDPSHADDYRANLKRFTTQVDAALVGWTRKMAAYRGAPVVSYHRTFNYFHRRFGLAGLGYVEERPGIPPAPAHLARLIRTMNSEKVRVIFHESFYDRQTSDLVAKRTGARVILVPISVGGIDGVDSYIALIDHLIDSVVAAMPPPGAG